VLAVFGMLAVLTGGVRAHAAAEPPGRIERIDLKTDGSSTKVIIMLSRPLPFEVHVLDGETARKSARRLVLDFANTTLASDAVFPIKVEDGLVQQIRTGQPTAGAARIVLDLASDTKHSVDAYETPPHVTIAIAGTPTAEAPAAAPEDQ
jgi:N-acetylmuramoyl-L-alanine amidase